MSKTIDITAIIEGLGGIDNIAKAGNCMTRLRVTVHDAALVDRKKLQAVQGVMGLAGDESNLQVILGPGKADAACQEIRKIQGGESQASVDHVEEFNQKKKGRNEIFTIISQIFTPLIPAFAGTGLLYGIMKLLQYIYIYFGVQLFNPAGIADGGSVFMAALSVIAGSFFSIMNIAVAGQAAKVRGGNLFVGLAVGAIVTNVGALNGISMGIMNLQFKSGLGGTFAALIGGMLAAKIEKSARKKLPNSLQIHFPALFSVVITGLALLFIIQPICGIVSDALSTAILWLVYNAGALGGTIISGTFLFLVAMGIHHIVTPINTLLLQEVGYTCLQGFTSLAGAGLAGVAVGLLIHYRDKKKYGKLRSAVFGNILTQLLGISEPMIYGISLPLWKPFLAANLGGACGGFVLGLFKTQGAETMMVSGLLGALVNTKPLAYLLGYATAVTGAAFFTCVLGVKNENMAVFLDDETENSNA